MHTKKKKKINKCNNNNNNNNNNGDDDDDNGYYDLQQWLDWLCLDVWVDQWKWALYIRTADILRRVLRTRGRKLKPEFNRSKRAKTADVSITTLDNNDNSNNDNNNNDNCVNNKMLESDWLLTALVYALIGCFKSKLSDLTCLITNICNRSGQIRQLSSQ